LQADIWLFSMDHRDITMLARDYCEAINRENKPAIMLHSILIETFSLSYICLLCVIQFVV
jgi:hypothetical protein